MGYMFKGIDHVQLAAPKNCEEKARAFFQDIIGWTEIPKPLALQARGGVWFKVGRHEVHIGVQEDFVPATKAHPAFEVDQLDTLRTHLKLSNINITDDEHRIDEGVKRFFIHDPFGNRIEFLEWDK